MNISAIKSKVETIINEYGKDIKIYRDIYETDGCGCKNKVESMAYVNTIKGVIDNSTNTANNKNNDRQGIIQLNAKASLYIPYKEQPELQENDYLEIDGVYYRVGIFLDLVHYNLLYQIPVERIELNE